MIKTWAGLLVVCMIMCQVLCVGASESVPSDQADGGYTYECWLENSDISLMVPVNMQCAIYTQESDIEVAMLGSSQFPDIYFVFFAIRSPSVRGVKLDQLQGKDLTEFLSIISNNPERTTSALVKDNASDGRPVLRVDEPLSGMPAQHLVTINGDWVLNMMIQRMDGDTTFPQEALDLQSSILALTLSMENAPKRAHEYTLPGTDIALRVPRNTYLRVMDETESFKNISVYQPEELNKEERGFPASLLSLSVIASKDPAFEGKSVETLEPALLNDLVQRFSLGPIDASKFTIDTQIAPGTPVLQYQTDDQLKINVLLAIRGDWAIAITFMPLETLDSAWAHNAQTELMRIAMGLQSDQEEWQPYRELRIESDRVILPLLPRAISLHIPEGFVAKIHSDDGGYRAASIEDPKGDGPSATIRVFHAPAFAGLTHESPEAGMILALTAEQEAEKMQEELETEVTKSEIAQGLFGYPSFLLVDKDGLTQTHCTFVDGSVVLYTLSASTPFTPEIAKTFCDLLGFEKAE